MPIFMKGRDHKFRLINTDAKEIDTNFSGHSNQLGQFFTEA